MAKNLKRIKQAVDLLEEELAEIEQRFEIVDDLLNALEEREGEDDFNEELYNKYEDEFYELDDAKDVVEYVIEHLNHLLGEVKD